MSSPTSTPTSTTRTCRCGRPVRHPRTICEAHVNRLHQMLAEVPALTHHLELTRTRARAAGLEGGGAGDALPWNDQASKILTALKATEVTWIRLLTEDRAVLEEWPADTIGACARWLLRHLEALARHELAADAAEQLLDIAERGWDVVDIPPERVYLGPCPACGVDLYAPIDAGVAECGACETVVDVATTKARLQAELDYRLVTAKEAAGYLALLGRGVKEDTIDRWRRRGRLHAIGQDEGRRWLYRFADVRYLAPMPVTDTRHEASA